MIFSREKPKRMSEEEWVKRKREIRARRAQEHIEYKTDGVIMTHTPWWIFHHKVMRFGVIVDQNK